MERRDRQTDRQTHNNVGKSRPAPTGAGSTTSKLKGNSSPKSFFVYRPSLSKEESGRIRRARSEQERAKRATQDCSHSRLAPCIPRRDTPNTYVTSLTQLADAVACEGFLLLYSKMFVGARARLNFWMFVRLSSHVVILCRWRAMRFF